MLLARLICNLTVTVYCWIEHQKDRNKPVVDLQTTTTTTTLTLHLQNQTYFPLSDMLLNTNRVNIYSKNCRANRMRLADSIMFLFILAGVDPDGISQGTQH